MCVYTHCAPFTPGSPVLNVALIESHPPGNSGLASVQYLCADTSTHGTRGWRYRTARIQHGDELVAHGTYRP